MLDWIPQKVNRAATEKKKRMTATFPPSIMNTLTSSSILHAAKDPEYGGVKLNPDEVMELRKDIIDLKESLVTLAEARSGRDKALARVKELEENQHDLYDEQGARDCCEDLGLVHQEDYDEVCEEVETLKAKIKKDDGLYEKLQEEYHEVCEERNARINKEEEKELRKFRDDVVSALQIDWNGDQETIDYIEEMEEKYDPEGMELLKEENKKLKEEKYLPIEAEFMGKTIKTKSIIHKDQLISQLGDEIKKLKEDMAHASKSQYEFAIASGRNLQKAETDMIKYINENEELKTSIQTTTSYWTDKIDLLKSEINNLQCVMKEKGITEKVFKVTLDGLMADTLPDQHDQM